MSVKERREGRREEKMSGGGGWEGERGDDSGNLAKSHRQLQISVPDGQIRSFQYLRSYTLVDVRLLCCHVLL
jgi:hypothetical protein